MCGLVGRVTRQLMPGLGPALDAMRHRGPDAGAEEHFRVGGWQVQLGHRRLSILDLSTAANQPFHGAGEGVIVFNGEIYNHASLREDMARRGRTFRTRSDTEVLLAGIEECGARFAGKLNGMFAFAVLDPARQKLFLGRDPFGIKPLYLARLDDGGIAFASELRALALAAGRRLEPDGSCLAEFLLNGFLYEPHSGFRGVEKLAAGTWLEIDIEAGGLCFRKHQADTESDAGDFAGLVERQLELEVEADVPVGVFFSGGIDSSVLLAAAPRDVSAFFVDHDGPAAPESIQAAAVAERLGVRLLRAPYAETEADDVVDQFRSVAAGTEEPISDFTYAATRLIARRAREAGFKVMLSGMGGDELFAGYPRYQAAKIWPWLRSFGRPVAGVSAVLRRFPNWSKKADRLASFAMAADFPRAYTSLVGYFAEAEVAKLLGSAEASDEFFAELQEMLRGHETESCLRQAMRLDRRGFLAHNLTVTDRASMAESIEVRVPLLSPGLAAWADAAGDSTLLRGRRAKLPLRHYLRRSLPRQLVEQPKVGFNPPLDRRIALVGAARCRDLLTHGPLRDWLDVGMVGKWVDEHFSQGRNHTYRIWQLLYLRFWFEQTATR